MGDFNQILYPSEHSNDSVFRGDHFGIHDFQQLVADCDLLDLSFIGSKFTWWNNQGADPIGKKLDRVLINEAWTRSFPRSYSEFEANGISDHARCRVHTSPPCFSRRYHFQFFNFLTTIPQFQEIIISNWNKTEPLFKSRVALLLLHKKLKALKPVLRELNKSRYGDITNRTKEAYNRLCTAQEHALNEPSTESFKDAADAMATWNHFASIEEMFFQQKSRICWLKNGDSNSTFFHRSVQTRASRNSIKRLINVNGEVISSHEGIKNEALSYFKNLLQQDCSLPPVLDQASLQSLIPYRCSQDAAASLIAPVTAEEIKQTLFAMPRNKSPGPDGFTVEFFTACWGTVGNDFTAAILSFFSYGFLPSGVNATKLILLPKSDSAQTIREFRPVACCNTSYKVISKIIANRLKRILPEAIQKNQCAFVKGRLLLENVLLATELVKNYHRKNISDRCVLKLDISKAFDSVRWDFIEAVLRAMALPELFIRWIMCCISSASFSVYLNGDLGGFFTSSRGIRQGCPMSPYIFVIAMNVLSLRLNEAAESGKIKYHPYCKDLKLNHLCFADDLMVFMNGNADSFTNTVKVIEDFHLISGLNINVSKSSIYIGGTSQHSLINKTRELGIPILNLPIRYLGLPLTTKNMTKGDFAPLVERIKNRLMAWSSKMLSYAGRLQLIKAVIKSITDFWCSAFRLPSKCFSIIDGMCSAFLWSGSPLNTSKAKVSWAEICTPFAEGGLGLRKSRISSQVFSLSLIWRLLTNAGSLWVAWVNRYLLHGTNFWDAKHSSRGSWIWRKLLKMRPLAQRFIHHEVHSGKNSLFWLDNWMNKTRLIERLGEDGIRRLGVRRLATVSEVVADGCWSFNRCRDSIICGIIREISSLTPPDPHASPDRFLWRHADTTFKDHFSAKKTWFLLHTHKPKVPWHRAVWFCHAIPRQAFITWLAVRNRLSTGDRTARWGQPQDCLLCGERLETRSHLFFACPFSFTIWSTLTSPLLRRTNPDWNATLSATSRTSKNKTDTFLLRLVFQSSIYHIWRERNYRRHNSKRHLIGSMIVFIREDIKNRLISLASEIPDEIYSRWTDISSSSTPRL